MFDKSEQFQNSEPSRTDRFKLDRGLRRAKQIAVGPFAYSVAQVESCVRDIDR